VTVASFGPSERQSSPYTISRESSAGSFPQDRNVLHFMQPARGRLLVPVCRSGQQFHTQGGECQQSGR
jgi:hypothetical protein